jgi:hypothetical protein
MVNNPDAAAGVPDITEAVPVNEKTAPAVTTATKKHRFVLQPKEEAAAAAAAAAPKKASAIEKSAGAAAASANSQPFDTSSSDDDDLLQHVDWDRLLLRLVDRAQDLLVRGGTA